MGLIFCRDIWPFVPQVFMIVWSERHHALLAPIWWGFQAAGCYELCSPMDQFHPQLWLQVMSSAWPSIADSGHIVQCPRAASTTCCSVGQIIHPNCFAGNLIHRQFVTEVYANTIMPVPCVVAPTLCMPQRQTVKGTKEEGWGLPWTACGKRAPALSNWKLLRLDRWGTSRSWMGSIFWRCYFASHFAGLQLLL